MCYGIHVSPLLTRTLPILDVFLCTWVACIDSRESVREWLCMYLEIYPTDATHFTQIIRDLSDRELIPPPS